MTTLMVQTDRLLHNYRLFGKQMEGTPVIPVLAGNAYGLGDTTVAQILFEEGVRFFACSRLEEALRIKQQFPSADVLLLTPYSSEEEARQIVEHDIIATVGSYDSGVVLSGMAQQLHKNARIHIKFDTGASRMGFSTSEVQKAVQTAKYLQSLQLCGVFTTITHAEAKKKKKVRQQYEKFKEAVMIMRREDIDCGLIHAAGSSTALKYPFLRLDAVRCGSALAGNLKIKDKWGFKKVGKLLSSICDVCWVSEKKDVGINNSYKTHKATKIALIPTGYMDGLGIGVDSDPFKASHIFSHIGQAIKKVVKGRKLYCDINGQKARIIGRVDFESVMADVSKIQCKSGDIVSFDTDPAFVNYSVKRSYV